ncbi:MAG: hypothetical protein FK730_00660 [Asgard group archaeon]|nr:hypothetical protein [Asgard group archaeon]
MLKKNKLIIISFILLFNLWNPIQTSSEIGVGDSFIYEITAAEHYFKIGKNEDYQEGFIFGSKNYPIGTYVNATIDAFDTPGAGFSFWLDNHSNISFFHPMWFDMAAIEISYKTLYYTYEMVENFQNAYLVHLTFYRIKPFIDPRFNDYMTSPITLGEDVCDYFEQYDYFYPDIECSYNYTITDNFTYYESWVGGEVDTSFGEIITGKNDYPSEISFGNNFQYYIDNETGLVYGYGIRGWIEGKIDGKKVRVSMHFQFELEGYDLPDYQYGSYQQFTSEIDNLAIIIAVPITCFLIILPVSYIIIRKIKKSKITTY